LNLALRTQTHSVANLEPVNAPAAMVLMLLSCRFL
jgi:hypothetical protein